MRKKFLLMTFLLAIIGFCGTSLSAENTGVAKVGDTEYAKLADAVNAAQTDDEIKVIADIATNLDLTISKKVTLDLGGFTLSDAGIKIASDVTIKNGKIVNTNEPYPLKVTGSGNLTVDGVAIEASKSDRAIWLDGSSSVLNFKSGSSILATKGTNNEKSKIYGVWVAQGATANIYGGKITVDAGANATAVAIFGNYENTVNIYGGKISTSGKTYSYAVWVDGDVTITGGEIVTNEKQYGYSSGITYGKNYAIYSKGDVEISGDTKITTYGPSGYIVNAGGSNQEVVITGGEFTNVLSEVDKTAGGHSEPNLIYGSSVAATIAGGDFNGYKCEELIKGTGSTLTITGGSFDNKPKDDYVAVGATITVGEKTYTKTEDGLEEVIPVASVNGTSYTDLQDAIVAAAPNGTVEILSDVTVDEWIMFSETLNIGSGQIITMNINGLTINGNDKTVTINSIESAGNGGYLIFDATNLNVKDLTIKYAEGLVGGIGLKSGTINNVTFIGGNYGVFPGASGVTIENCKFNGTKSSAVYYEEGRQGIVVKNNSFNTADGAYAITMRSNEQFTGNTITKGKVNIANSSSAIVTGNNFGQERFKVYNAATATIEDNEINVLAFNDESVVFSTFGENTLSTEAQVVLNGASFPVAQIGTTKYGTLQAAINAVQNGETITLLSDITENVTLTEKVGLYYTIDGSDKTMNGSITVNPLSDTNDNRRITISNINFVENTDTDVNFISAVKTNHYPRLTISDCDFTGSGNDGDVAIRLKSSHSVVINDCTGTKLHSFLQNTSGWNLTINNVAVTESKGGLALGTVQGVTVKGSNIDVNGYGIRLDANTYNNNAVIETCTVNAFIPVVVRNVNTESSITFNGTNTMTQTNTDGLWCAIGTTEYEENGTMPTAPTGDVTVTLNGTGLSMDGVYGNYYEFSGEGTAENPYLINNLYELKYFRDDVNGGNNYAGKYIQLNADIDLAGENWVGIGTATTDHGFMGNFDGKTYKIKNLTITNPALDSDNYAYAGLFGVTEGTETAQNTIKNLTIENVTISTTGHIVSAAIAYPYYTIVDNVKVCGNINITGGDYTAGALAYTRRCVDASNITVEGGENSIIKGEKTVGGVISDIQMNGGLTANYSNFSASNVTVEGDMSVGGISGIIAGQTLNTCSVMNVTLVCSDNRVGIVSGSLGAPSTITNVTVDNVTGATNIIGATYDGGKAVEAKIGDTYYASLQAALDAAAAGTGNVTVEILEDINLTGIDWNPVTVSAPNYPVVTVNGNDYTITGLNDMLFAGTWAGNSGLIINNLTIANSNIVNDKDDTQGTVGVGAFIGYPQASATITLNNCHLENSTVEGGHWTGGLIGMAGGYNGNDGPVFMNLTIEDCSVTGSIITGKGSCGGIIGHGSCAAWTAVNIQNTTVSGNTVTSTGSSTNKAGAVMGTIGAAGQPTTANGVTKTGGAMVAATVSGNTVTSGGTAITTIYGRQGTETGILELNGGSYDNYPIEQNVAYAKPAAGLMIEENEHGTYGLVVDPAYGKVAMIGETYYASLQEAVNVGGEVKVIADITLTETVTVAADKTVVLDLNGKTINAGWADETAGKHIYAFTNNGTLTIKDSSTEANGTINARGIFNYGAMTLTSGTINAIDGNGGYGVRNYPGATFTMNGGTIATTLEDDNKVDKGGYDASPVRVDEGATFTMNGGVINNICDFTVAIDNYGTTIINDGKATTVHTTLANSGTMTINGGEFTCNGIEGITAHALWAADGTTTITGGTFDGKDNYNGFNVDASEGATVYITGGNFLPVHSGSLYGEGTIAVSGGTFFDAVPEERCAAGYIPQDNADGTYGVVEGLTGEGTEENPYLIKSLTDLTFFRDTVNNGNTYAGKYIKLTANIDLAPTRSESNWTPIGNSTNKFQGTFDGQNHTISNLVINGGSSSNQGFFGFTTNGEIKNVIFNNAKVSGRLNVGVVAGTPYTSKYTNIKVTGHVEVNGMAYVGGVGGKNAYANWTDITVSVDETSYVNAYSVENGTAYRTYVGGVIGFNGEGGHTFKNITSNIKVIGSTMDVGGIFGILHYGNKAENVTFTGAVEAPADAKEVGGIAGVWHNERGQTVTITNAKSEGTVKVGDVTTTGSIVGGAYNADNETADNSGSLIIDGNEAWLKVAQIGEAKYLTLHEAFNAATEGQTVTVINDVELESTVTVAAGKVVTLDLNGKTINAGWENQSAGKHIYAFENHGTLTIEGEGTINARGNYNHGIMTLVNGTINGIDVNGGYAICNYGGATFTMKGGAINVHEDDPSDSATSGNYDATALNNEGTAILEGGTITSTSNFVYAVQNKGTLTIEDGMTIKGRGGVSVYSGIVTVEGGNIQNDKENNTTGHAFYVAGGELVINGGDITATNDKNDGNSVVYVAKDAKATINGGKFTTNEFTKTPYGPDGCNITIKGGTFDKEVVEKYIAEGYKAVQIGENVYEVRIASFEKFYTAAGVETTSDNAAYSLMFNVTDYANKELSVKIGNKKPAQNSSINLVTPVTATFDGITFNVTSVADNGFNSTRFKTVTISEGVRTLGTKALANMYDLTSVVFPSTLVSVGDNCFHGYGDSHKIKSITSYAVDAPAASGNWQTVPFQQCIANVAVLIVPNAVSYEEYATAPGWSRFYEEPNGGLINHIIGIGTELEIAGKENKYTMIATITSMDPKKECSIKIGQKPASNSNAELVLPEVVDYFPSVEGLDFTVTSIPNQAFLQCYNFTGNLEIPATVKTIGNSAFLQAYYNTLNVGKLTLNEGLETILNSAFTLSYFNNENLVIPTTVTTIGSHAFNATNMSGTLTVKKNIPGGFSGFAGSLFTMVVVEEGVTSIVDSSSKGVFSKMSKLETVILPSTLEEIGVAAFSEDLAITTIITSATAQVPAIENTNAFDASVKTNATVWVVGNSYDDVLAYKANAKWNEFANIHLYGAVAQIGEVEYLTIQEAIAAATSGQTITLLADVEAADGNPVLIPEGVTLDINTHNVTANIYGTVKTSGGLWTTVTVPGFNSRKMLGNGAIYNTTDATVANSASEVKMLAGSIVLNPNPETEWWTLPNQDLSIASGASFEVPANIKFTVRENTHVVVYGTLTVNGVVYLQMDATVEAAAGLNILTDVEGYMVSYEDGVYSVVQTIFTQTTQLNAGWNWFSYYVNTDLETLENELGESAAQIKSHKQGFDTYAGPETWIGSLNEILPEQMYMINANVPSTLNLKGEIIDHENVEITLVKNAWNWIGYPINGSVNLSDAFKGVDITIGDQIKSHNHGFAYYAGNNTWIGELQVLVKGEGYMYHNTSDKNVVFTYNVPQGKSNSELKSNITSENNYWTPNASQYPNNMTMTAMVDIEGGDYEVAAFVDGEVRGSARPIYVEPIDAYVLFLTIHGEGVEEMTFKFYDLTTGEEFDLNDRMNYSDDAIVGSLKEPYMFNRGTTGIGEAAMSEVNIYPNPTTTGTEINLQATCDKVEVFNALGVKVAEYQNVDSIDALETAGIYVIRITNGGNVKHCSLVVK